MYKVDVYLRVRRAVMVEGMSIREAARTFGLHRNTLRKMLAYSVSPDYRRLQQVDHNRVHTSMDKAAVLREIAESVVPSEDTLCPRRAGTGSTPAHHQRREHRRAGLPRNRGGYQRPL